LQNDACRLPGAVDRANNFRKAAVAKGTIRMAIGRQVEAFQTGALAWLLFVFPAGVLTNLNTTQKGELRVAVKHRHRGFVDAICIFSTLRHEKASERRPFSRNGGLATTARGSPSAVSFARHHHTLAKKIVPCKFIIGRPRHAAFFPVDRFFHGVFLTAQVSKSVRN
jgi:hypothetical protein